MGTDEASVPEHVPSAAPALPAHAVAFAALTRKDGARMEPDTCWGTWSQDEDEGQPLKGPSNPNYSKFYGC